MNHTYILYTYILYTYIHTIYIHTYIHTWLYTSFTLIHQNNKEVLVASEIRWYLFHAWIEIKAIYFDLSSVGRCFGLYYLLNHLIDIFLGHTVFMIILGLWIRSVRLEELLVLFFQLTPHWYKQKLSFVKLQNKTRRIGNNITSIYCQETKKIVKPVILLPRLPILHQ